MLKNSNSCEFDYEAFCDEIFASNPSSPPLLAFQDAIECGHSASSFNNNHEQEGSHDSDLMNDINLQYKDVFGGHLVGPSPLLHLHASNNQKKDDPVIEIPSSGEDDEKEEKHYQVQNFKKHAAAVTGHHHQEAINNISDLKSLMRKRASNREASKRARKKKQAQLAQLQSRITELKLNGSSLSKKLAVITQKLKGEAEENIALKDRIDKLRKRVNIGELAFKKAMLESNPRFHFQTGTSGSPPPYSQKIGALQTSLPGVLVEDGGAHHHQTSRHDLEIHQLPDKESVNQHITTTPTELQSLFLPPTAWDDMNLAMSHF